MDKEEFVCKVKEILEDVFDATSFYSVIMQLRDAQEHKNDVVNLSPGFYTITFMALQRACFMTIAKLYENSDDVFSLGTILKIYQENREWFPEYASISEFNDGENMHRTAYPYKHTVKPAEECYFKDEVAKYKDSQYFSETRPLTVYLTFSEYLDLYQKRFSALSKKKEHIRIQRNKHYAHNDTQALLNLEQIFRKNPVSLQDMSDMIDFAQDLVFLVLELLTKVCHVYEILGNDDLSNTLEMAELGMKYQEYDIEQATQKLLGGDTDDELQ